MDRDTNLDSITLFITAKNTVHSVYPINQLHYLLKRCTMYKDGEWFESGQFENNEKADYSCI